MTKRIVIVLSVLAVLLLIGVACAQVTYEFHCTGQGNMVKEGDPVVYSGLIDSGDLASGEWTITIDDSGWQPVGNDSLRWDYIWRSHYVYEEWACHWIGTFDGSDLFLSHAGHGTMSGTCCMFFIILDWNCNGMLDPYECMDGPLGAEILIDDQGTEAYAGLCGPGIFEGLYFHDFDPGSPTYMLDSVDFEMRLELDCCGASTIQQSAWGNIKSLFR